MIKKIGIVTGTRADYGLLSTIIKLVHQSAKFELQLYVTGSHLTPSLGETIWEIENDKIPITETIDVLLSSGRPTAVSKATGLAMIGFSEAFERNKPDIVLVLGDRFEILGATQAAAFAGIPIAHFHGGEVTLGAFDEFIRHSITKMASVHFVASETYRKRVIQMGEEPWRVHNVGAPGLDALNEINLLSKSELEEQIGFNLGSDFLLVTYHPETTGTQKPLVALNSLLDSLSGFLKSFKLLITYPNPDSFGSTLVERLQVFQSENQDSVYLSPSLGRHRYLSAMALCRAVI